MPLFRFVGRVHTEFLFFGIVKMCARKTDQITGSGTERVGICWCVFALNLALSLSRRSLDVFDFANYISVFRALSFAGARVRAAYAFNLSRSRRRRTRRWVPAVLMKLYSRDNCISRACYKRSGAQTHTLAPASSTKRSEHGSSSARWLRVCESIA